MTWHERAAVIHFGLHLIGMIPSFLVNVSVTPFRQMVKLFGLHLICVEPAIFPATAAETKTPVSVWIVTQGFSFVVGTAAGSVLIALIELPGLHPTCIEPAIFPATAAEAETHVPVWIVKQGFSFIIGTAAGSILIALFFHQKHDTLLIKAVKNGPPIDRRARI
jgi:hypothetical protein